MKACEYVLFERRDFDLHFWSQVDKSGDCWLWTGLRNIFGYGRFTFDSSSMMAHRASWVINNAQMPLELNVLHKCDVRLCVNPKHLWLGTNRDNALDMSAKGRAPTPLAKLTEQQVREIRARRKNGEKGVDLAREYGLCPRQIARINTGHYWRHV